MPPVQRTMSSAQKTTTSSGEKTSMMSHFMCCTSDRSGQVVTRSASFREKQTMSGPKNPTKYLWLDPTRWVEKTTVKTEKVGKLERLK